MNPSLYDLLDVEPDASAEEIRAAWRSAIADLDPSDRRFRAYNQAAETLLDPARREEYDAGRATEDDAREAAAEPSTRAEEPAPVAPVETAPEEPARASGTDVGGSSRRQVSVLTLVLVVLACVLLTAGAAFYTWKAADVAQDQDRVESTERAATAADEAAAEAAVPLLSYDHRNLQSDLARALPYMTEERAGEYERLMEELRPDARKQKIAVQADVVATGVVRASEERAQVLVFVDQATTKAGRQTDPLQMWVTMTMVEQDGQWLVDEMKVDQVLPG